MFSNTRTDCADQTFGILINSQIDNFEFSFVKFELCQQVFHIRIVTVVLNFVARKSILLDSTKITVIHSTSYYCRDIGLRLLSSRFFVQNASLFVWLGRSFLSDFQRIHDSWTTSFSDRLVCPCPWMAFSVYPCLSGQLQLNQQGQQKLLALLQISKTGYELPAFSKFKISIVS